MSVIDPSLRFPQCARVLTHDEIRAELIRQVDAKMFTQKALADHLGVAPARVKEVLLGKRRIQQDEMPAVAKWLGLEARGNAPATEVNRSIAMPVSLPSLDALTDMFVSLLEQVDVDPHEGERAEKLARSFPGVLQAALLRQAGWDGDMLSNLAKLPHVGDEDRSLP